MTLPSLVRYLCLFVFALLALPGISAEYNWSYDKTSGGGISYAFCGNGGEIPTTAFLDKDHNLVYPKGTLDWTSEQKAAVVSALNTIENTFANVPGRSVRIAFAFTELRVGTLASTALDNRIKGGKDTWEQGDLGGNVSGQKAFIADLDKVWKYGMSDDNPLLLADIVIQIDARTMINDPGYFYYGDSLSGITRNQMDFETLIIHEMGHALGFYNGWGEAGVSAFDALTVAVPGPVGKNELYFQGEQTIDYMKSIGNDLFDYTPSSTYNPEMGARLEPRDYEPDKADHLERYIEYKDATMPPYGMNGKVLRQYSDLELAMFKDMGWTLANDPFVSVPEPGSATLVLLSLGMAFIRRRRAA